MKVARGSQNCLYPMPLTLVGANVREEPNYITIAHVGIMDFFSISISLGKSYYTNAGIRENQTFSVNLPSTDMVKEVEYCGLVSGKRAEKSTLFDNFYGKLQTAPMIQECPINMECQVVKTVDFPNHTVFIGEIAETYYDDAYMTDGTVDFRKAQPILFILQDIGYWRLGERFAKAWNLEERLHAD
jgi:flavin reductase (DIM6/NTAB) family NADH-FMN oxidoreductase RutF